MTESRVLGAQDTEVLENSRETPRTPCGYCTHGGTTGIAYPGGYHPGGVLGGGDLSFTVGAQIIMTCRLTNHIHTWC